MWLVLCFCMFYIVPHDAREELGNEGEDTSAMVAIGSACLQS